MRGGVHARRPLEPRAAATEVISNALILSITVLLFGSLTVWVTSLEGPDRKTEVDLDATLTVTASAGIINVTHTGGPTLYENLVLFLVKIDTTMLNLDLSDGMAGTRWEMGSVWSYTDNSITSNSRVTLLIKSDTTEDILLDVVLQSGTLAGSVAPVVGMAWTTPDTVVGDGASTYRVKAFVTDRDGDLNATGGTVDLSGVGGGAAVVLSDTDGDGTYRTATQTLPASVEPGTYNLTLTFTDAGARIGTGIAQLKVRALDAVFIHGTTLTARTEATDWTAATLKSGASVTYSVVTLADSDADGDMDVVAGGGVKLFHYANGGWAETTVDADTGSDVTVLLAADINGGGGTDVVAGTTGGDIFWYNAGGGWARTTVTTAIATEVSGLAAVDIDGDSDLDIIAGTSGGKVVQFLNDGSWTTSEIEAGVGAAVTSLVAADLGVGNANPDIVIGTDDNEIYLYTSGGAWTRSLIDGSIGTAASVDALALGDCDGDGDSDLFAGTDESKVQRYLNDGSWTKGTVDDDAGAAVTSLGVGDADGDGNLDLVASAGTGLLWYANDFYWTRTSIATVASLAAVTVGEVTHAA